MKRWRWYVLMVFVAVAGTGWIYLTRVPDASEVAARVAAHVNFRAPELSLDTLDGRRASLSDLKGQIVLINFWATWCPPCRSEMPAIQAVYQSHHGDLAVLAVNEAEDPEIVKGFVGSFAFGFPILLDRDGSAGRQFQVKALPTSFFVDRTGVIRAANVGQMDQAFIEAQIAALAAR
ncbi:MAG: TlpA family protein disulfide reductase [Chloroflexi bacterium]|nr:TlpA family protein disulfide reductase [Chloroflexota bacterium]